MLLPPFIIAFYCLFSHLVRLNRKGTRMKRVGVENTAGANDVAQILLIFYPRLLIGDVPDSFK